MSMFILSQNAKVGVYGNGDRVIGSAGTEKALIMNGASNTIVDNTVEEIHLQNNIENYSFSVDENTNTVSILNGSTVLASFAANETGIKLFSANGMSVIKMNLDPETGDASFTADNGATGATPVSLPIDGTALPADAIDTNAKSENAGGDTPTPTPTVKEFTVDEYDAAVIAGTLPEAYALNDTAAELAGATYAAVTGATSITLEDSVEFLTTAANATTVATATAMATKVVVADSLNNLLAVSLPEGGIGGKPTSLLVTGKVNPKVVLDDISVAKAATAQADLDAFLARTDVAYDADSGAKKPDALTLSSYSITDDAAAIAAANADATQKALLTAAEEVNIFDTMAGISAVPVDTFNLVSLGKAKGTITVDDSLAAFSDANPSETILKALNGAGASFTVSDTGDIPEVDIAGLMNFKLGNAQLLLDGDITSVSLTAEASKTAIGSSTSSSFEVDSFFDITTSTTFTGTINFTGSNLDDDIKASTKGGIIDGGLGADKITLQAANSVDTVVLGTGVNKVADFEGDTIVGFNAETAVGTVADKLDFDGFLSDFALIKGATANSGSITGASFVDHGIAIIQDSVASDKISEMFSADTATVGSGYEMLLLVDESNSSHKTHVWFVSDANSDGKIAADEITLVATLDSVDATKLTADNIA